MHRILRLMSVASCVLALATVLFAQNAPAPTPAPVAASTEERIANLERLLAETRAELATLKTAATGASDAQLVELERKIDILGAEIETLKVGEAAGTSEVAMADRTDARYGLGVAASKVYGVKRGVSLEIGRAHV